MEFESILKSIVKNKTDYNDWFDIADVIYCQYITGISFFSSKEIKEYANVILRAKDEQNFFHSTAAKKSHNKFHSTAYALSALKLSSKLTGTNLFPYEVLMQLNKSIDYSICIPCNLSTLDKVHVWKASHTFGGISSILQMAVNEGYSISNPVIEYYEKIISTDGLWRLSPLPYQLFFDSLYWIKHNPKFAKYGGAAHLYWHLKTLPDKVNAELAVSKILRIYEKGYILEKIPYCLDYDILYMLRFFKLNYNFDIEIAKKIDNIFLNVGLSLIQFLGKSNEKLWLHALPGLLATLQITTESSSIETLFEENNINLNDPMEIVTWL